MMFHHNNMEVTNTPISQEEPNKTYWFPKWDFGGIFTLICHLG